MKKERLMVKVGGSLFYGDTELIEGVVSSLCAITGQYQVVLIVGSGPMGEFYKSIRKRVGINASLPSVPGYTDDKVIWNLIQAINLRLISFAIQQNVAHPQTAFFDESASLDCLKACKADFIMITPSDELISRRWQEYGKQLHGREKIDFESVNCQKSDLKALIYGDMLAINRYIVLTDVPGVFSDDPGKNADAMLFGQLSFEELKDIEFPRNGLPGRSTSLDRGVSLLLGKLLPNGSELYVTSHDFFARMRDDRQKDLFEYLKKGGTWISGNIHML